MNLRKSTLLITGGTLIALIAVVLALASYMLLHGFANLDRRQAGKDSDRVCQELATELDNLTRTGQDWARWDDTYEFVRGNNPSYAGDNLGDDSVLQLRLALMAFVDNSGKIVTIRSYAPDTAAPCEPLPRLRRFLDEPTSWMSPEIPLEIVSGIVLTDGPPLLVVSLPVIHSNGEGPAGGRLLVGRWLDSTLLSDISVRTKTKPRLLAPPLPGGVDLLTMGEPYVQEEGASTLSTGTPQPAYEVRVRSAGPDSLQGIALVRDIRGAPAFVIITPERRAIHAEGVKAVRLLSVLILAIGIGFSLLILLPLERRILARMGRLHDQVGNIADNWQPGARVKVAGTDEIAGLALTINRLLAALAESHGGQQAMLEDLRKSKEAAESATRSKSAFLANTSHEIRTPMNGVLGMIGILLKSPLSDEQREWALTIQSSAEALLGILNDILDLSRIEEGKLTLERTPFDLLDVIEDAVSLMAWRAHEKNLDLFVSVAAGTPTTIVGDPLRTRQIVVNLLGNAIKFTNTGEVSVALMQVASSGPLRRYRLEVRDTGIGVPQDQQAAIFETYTQAEASIARKFGGSGLGLTITRELVRLFDGSLGVESSIGKGSTFWVELPGEGVGAKEAPDPSLGDVRVLVVEGHPGSRQSLVRQLEEWGCRCDAAATEEEAALRTHNGAYQLVLLDSGFLANRNNRILRRIREAEANSRTPIVLVSPTCGSEKIPRGWAVAGTLLKPVRRARLWTLLMDILGRTFPIGKPEPSPEPVPTTQPGGGRPQGDRSLSAASPASAIPETGPRLVPRVLLAEDHPINRTVAITLLKHMNIEADVAVNGVEAVEMSSRFPYPIILMDVQMPVMDGLEATRSIREREKGTEEHVIILAMTANAAQADRIACLDAGMDDHLAKPVSQAALKRAMEVWSGRIADGTSAERGAADGGEDDELGRKAA